MIILGIDTSTKFLCLAAQDAAGKVYELRLEAGKKLATILAPNIKRVLDSLGLSVKDVDYFACGTGPGSFTGIRIGLSTIKAMAFACKKPVVGISSLDILAMNAAGKRGAICPAVDAKRGLVYYSVYKSVSSSIKRLAPYKLGPPGELAGIKMVGPRFFLGDAVRLYKEDVFSRIKGAECLDEEHSYPRPGNIISLAKERIEARQAKSSFELQAAYLYPKECQIRKP